MAIKTIIIANIAEAFEDTLNRVKSSQQKLRRIQIEHNLCDRTLLWEGDDKIVITPFSISKEIFQRNADALGFKNVFNLYPRKITISLSDAIKEDKILFSKLCKIINENPGIRITPYCVTKKFLLLSESFKKKGLSFTLEERPVRSSDWLVRYLDSKVGSRSEVNKIQDIKIKVPESVICRDKDEVTSVVKWFYENNRSCVIKANYGESGWGLIIIKRSLFENFIAVINRIKREFKKDSIWEKELILVEEFIEPNKIFSSGSPSSELFLSGDGAKITYLCDQLLGENGEFWGVVLGCVLLNNKISKEIYKVSLAIGKRFWQLGYRGFFDIDFVLSKNNEPYIIETNTRRTGGTHVYDVAKTIFGNDWAKTAFIVSQDNFQYGKKKLREAQIIDKMMNIMYPIKGKKEGIIISIINKWQPTFGFIIVSSSRKRMLEIRNQLLRIWCIKN